MKNFSIIGAGFAGLSLAYHLLSLGKEVTIYAPHGPRGGASAIATGLLHPYLGPLGKKARFADEALLESKTLLAKMQTYASSPLFSTEGVFRPACYPHQEKMFRKQLKRFEELRWQEKGPFDCSFPGFFIPSAWKVYAKDYLATLWEYCKNQGAFCIHEQVSSLVPLQKQYDHVILACGEGLLHLGEKFSSPLHAVKGQLLRFSWPSNSPPLPYSVVGKKYLVMEKGNKSCLVGSTYEQDYLSKDPDEKVAKELILPEAYSLLPSLKEASYLETLSQVRIYGPNKVEPWIKEVEEGLTIFSGLGSRGLLYHALFAKKLAYHLSDLPYPKTTEEPAL